MFRVEDKAQEDQRRPGAGGENLPRTAAPAALARPTAQTGPNSKERQSPSATGTQGNEVLPRLEDAVQAGVSTPESAERPGCSLTHSGPSRECLGKHLYGLGAASVGVVGILHRLFSCLSASHTGCFWNKIPKLQHRQTPETRRASIRTLPSSFLRHKISTPITTKSRHLQSCWLISPSTLIMGHPSSLLTIRPHF